MLFSDKSLTTEQTAAITVMNLTYDYVSCISSIDCFSLIVEIECAIQEGSYEKYLIIIRYQSAYQKLSF